MPTALPKNSLNFYKFNQKHNFIGRRQLYMTTITSYSRDSISSYRYETLPT